MQHPFQERRALLRDNFVEVKGEFAFAKNMDANSIEEIQAFLEESVKDSCEGLMVKMLNGEGSSYEPSKRSMNWLKVFLPHAQSNRRSKRTTSLVSETRLISLSSARFTAAENGPTSTVPTSLPATTPPPKNTKQSVKSELASPTKS